MYFDSWEDPAIHGCLGASSICTFWMVGDVEHFLHVPWALRCLLWKNVFLDHLSVFETGFAGFGFLGVLGITW